jgi:uncharacterized protein YgfB (UPF0149 family)
MKNQAFPVFDEVSEVLKSIATNPHPSQIHGLLCGMLCGSEKDTRVWLNHFMQPTDAIFNDPIFKRLHNQSLEQLNDFSFDFKLLLPDEDELVMARSEALTFWVQGFLTGLESVHIPIKRFTDDDITESLNDLIQIAQLHFEEAGSTEENETAYSELVEYVRMVAVMIYVDSQTARQSSAMQVH